MKKKILVALTLCITTAQLFADNVILKNQGRSPVTFRAVYSAETADNRSPFLILGPVAIGDTISIARSHELGSLRAIDIINTDNTAKHIIENVTRSSYTVSQDMSGRWYLKE